MAGESLRGVKGEGGTMKDSRHESESLRCPAHLVFRAGDSAFLLLRDELRQLTKGEGCPSNQNGR